MSTDKWMKETKKKVQKQAYKYIINWVFKKLHISVKKGE
jgi:hypothetical protein